MKYNIIYKSADGLSLSEGWHLDDRPAMEIYRPVIISPRITGSAAVISHRVYRFVEELSIGEDGITLLYMETVR